MERVSQMEEYIREYRNIRQSEKSGMIEKEYHCLLPSLYTYMDSLIKEQTFRRKSDEQEGIKYILFFRLLSSGYTQEKLSSKYIMELLIPSAIS